MHAQLAAAAEPGPDLRPPAPPSPPAPAAAGEAPPPPTARDGPCECDATQVRSFVTQHSGVRC
eukprot:13378035-Alexandrium_andersonii.AAC.1